MYQILLILSYILNFRGFKVRILHQFLCPFQSSSPGFFFYILNAMDRKWPIDNFCQAVSSASASPGSYDMRVSLYNFKGSSDGDKNNGLPDMGHPGVILNARDSLNYDFVYFR